MFNNTGLKTWIIGIIVVGTMLAVLTTFADAPSLSADPVFNMIPGRSVEDKITFSAKYVPGDDKFSMLVHVPKGLGFPAKNVLVEREYKEENSLCQNYQVPLNVEGDVFNEGGHKLSFEMENDLSPDTDPLPAEVDPWDSGSRLSSGPVPDSSVPFGITGMSIESGDELGGVFNALNCCSLGGSMHFKLVIKKDDEPKNDIIKIRRYTCLRHNGKWIVESY